MTVRNRTPNRVEDNDPRSPMFPNHLQNNPEALVGHTLIADAIKRGYNPDGYAHLNHISDRNVRDSNDDGTIFIYETETTLGTVTDYDPDTDTYTVVEEDMEFQQETGEWPNKTEIKTVERTIPADTVRSKLRDGYGNFTDDGYWWVSC